MENKLDLIIIGILVFTVSFLIVLAYNLDNQYNNLEKEFSDYKEEGKYFSFELSDGSIYYSQNGIYWTNKITELETIDSRQVMKMKEFPEEEFKQYLNQKNNEVKK